MLHRRENVTLQKKKPEHELRSDSIWWRRRRDSNPRTAYDDYTISSRAPSTGLGDFSKSIIRPLSVSAQKAALLYHKAVSFVNCFLLFVSAE